MKMSKEIEYNLERIATEIISVAPYFTNTRLFLEEGGHYGDSIKMALQTHIASRIIGEETLTFYPKRQSIWDYFFLKKPKPFQVKVIAKDVIKNPPPTSNNVIRMYEID